MPRSHSPSRSRSPSSARSRSRSRSPMKSASRSRSPVKGRRSPSVDMPKGSSDDKCPFLIRLYLTKGKHTPMADFDEGRLPLQDEFQVYGWNHSTPSSLIQLIYPSLPAPYRSPVARFSFRHIYVDASQRGLYRSKDLVSFTGRELMEAALPPSRERDGGAGADSNMDIDLDHYNHSGSDSRQQGRRVIDEKSLDAYGFITGDLISVSLFTPDQRMGLRRPDAPAFGSAPGASAGGVGGGRGEANFGRQAPGANGNAAGAGGPGGQDRTTDGSWHRGAPLPPQNATGPGGAGRRESNHAPGTGVDAPRWGRGGGNIGGGFAPARMHAGAGTGAGGPGAGGRERSPDYTRGGRRSASPPTRDREREGRDEGSGAKRESWNTRRGG